MSEPPRVAGFTPTSVESVRTATAAAANRSIDLSYITDDYLAQAHGAEYATDIGEKFEGPKADEIIRTYGGLPIGHLVVFYGHQAAVIQGTWRLRLVKYNDGVWTAQNTIARAAPTSASIVAECHDGSPLWDFRI